MNPQANKRKQLLIYAGVAGAVIALVVILKKRSEPAAANSTEATSPTYSTAPSTIPATGETGEGLANSLALRGELANFETQLTTQLPEAIKSAVKAGSEGQQTGGGAPSLGEIGSFISALGIGGYRANGTGEQTGAGTSTSPSQGTTAAQPTPIVINVPAAPSSGGASAPVAVPPPAKSTASGCPSSFPMSGPHGCYHSGKCGNGCEGHFYQNGTTECQTKKNGKCSW